MNRNKRLQLTSAALVLVGVGFWFYNNHEADSSLQSPAPMAKPAGKGRELAVNAKVIKSSLLVDEFYTTGVLLPNESVDLSFESAGKIVEICFEEGAAVKRGDLLARTNDAQLQAQRSRLTAQLQLAQDRVYRQSKLLERDAVSREALEQVETDLATLKADIEIIDAQIDKTRLYAPFDGVVGLRQVSVGQYATLTTVVAHLASNKPLKVEFAIPERYAGSVGAGTNLEFTVEGSLEKFGAKVYAADATIDPELHQYTMRAIYPNTRGELMAGLFALVDLKKDEVKDALVVPAESIITEMGQDRVYLYKSGKAVPTSLTLGIRTESDVEVLQGLSMGDTVIVSGTMQLRSGMSVKINNLE